MTHHDISVLCGGIAIGLVIGFFLFALAVHNVTMRPK